MGHGPSFRRCAQNNPDVTLAACCDLDAEKAEKFRSSFGFAEAYTDIDQMIREEKPDALSLVVPVPLTAQLTVKFLRLGIPVILEKPPGMNREETLWMIEEAEKSGTPNQVAFNRRYMPLVDRFQKLRQACTANLWQYDFFRVNRQDRDFSTTCIHGIDTMGFLAGTPYRSVDFTYRAVPGAGSWVADILLECEFADGSAGRITFAPMTGVIAERCTMHGTNEIISAQLPVFGSIDGHGSLIHVKSGTVIENETPEPTENFVENGFYGENAAFFDCIRVGKKPVGDIRSSLQTVEIAACIRDRKSSISFS